MVALLVLATFAVFILVDVLLHREKYKFRVEEAVGETAQSVPTVIVAGVALPEMIAYHPGHTWALDQGNGRVRIGLDEFAASLLGPIERLEIPQRGRWVGQGEKGWTVVTERGEVPMLAPAEGEVVALNDKALSKPEVVSQDPYGAGWLMEIFSPDARVSFRNLLTGGLARRWMEESVEALRQALSPRALATALDGGRIAPQLGQSLSVEQWRELTRDFFRCG
jgi:glycine cleavage system H lipoate-binding protein